MAPLVLVLGLGSRARFAGRLVMAAGVLGNSPLRWGVRGQGWRAGPLGWNAYSWLECDGACTKMATELVIVVIVVVVVVRLTGSQGASNRIRDDD